MTRPNQDITLYGAATRYWSDTGNTDAFLNPSYSYKETVSGTSRRRPKGWKDPTPYSLDIVTTRHVKGISKWSQLSNYWTLRSGCLEGLACDAPSYSSVLPLASVNTVPASDITRAIIEARLNLEDNKVNLGVAFGERKKTASLVGDTAKRIAISIRHLKNGRIRKAMDELGISSKKSQPRGSNVPSKWLELQYGWKPLLTDVYGSIEALAEKPVHEWRVTSYGVVSSSNVSAYAEVLPFPAANTGAGWTRVESTIRSTRVRLDAIPANELKSSVASLGITNPLEVGWELVPFSFVVDWFLPIGDWLGAMDSLLGYEEAVQTVSVFVKAKGTKGGLSKSWSSVNYTVNDYSGSYDSVHLVRTVSPATMPLWPGFKDPRSLGHMANGLALLCGVMGRDYSSRWKYIR